MPPPGSIEQLLATGVVGVMFVLVMLGYLAPKWAMDELRTQIKVKDAVIERLTTAVEVLADKAERDERRR